MSHIEPRGRRFFLIAGVQVAQGFVEEADIGRHCYRLFVLGRRRDAGRGHAAQGEDAPATGARGEARW